VLVVLVLVATPVFINQATVGPNWKKAYQAKATENAVLSQQCRLAELKVQQLGQERDEAVKRAEEISLTRRQDVEKLQNDLEARRVEVAGLQGELQKANNELVKLRGDLDLVNKRTEQLASQLDESRKKIDALNEENRRLTEDLHKSQADYVNVEKLARVRHEQLVKYEERIKELERKIEDMGKSPGTAEGEGGAASSEQILGTITAVKQDQASVNIGSATGVRSGMKLIIYRGTQFVGYLRVEMVDTNSAAGIVVDKQLDPMQGDKVANVLLKQ